MIRFAGKKRPPVRGKVRYALVGAGHIAQAAVLPSFAHAKKNSELKAIVSGDREKREKLGRRYGAHTFAYEEYEACLDSGLIDAVYISLPNSMHCEYAVKALNAGIHVLCEKPMAVTEEDCRKMIRASEESGARLMIAYRLHFESANLRAAEIARSGKLGDLRAFQSALTMPVKPGDIRLDSKLGGGTLYDIGIYCINAARWMFRSEPIEVSAMTATSGDPRFREVEEQASVSLRFPGDRIASFFASFSASKLSYFEIVGTKGVLRVDPAFAYVLDLKHELRVGKNRTKSVFKRGDQFAPELLYFSDCVKRGLYPEPSGAEGLADVRVIRAAYRSAETGQPVALGEFARSKRPDISQEITRPPVRHEPPLVRAQSPSG